MAETYHCYAIMRESDRADIVTFENTTGCGGGPYLNVTSDSLMAAPANLSTTGNLQPMVNVEVVNRKLPVFAYLNFTSGSGMTGFNSGNFSSILILL